MFSFGSTKKGFGVLLFIILAAVIILGNLEILNRLADIRHQSAPLPSVPAIAERNIQRQVDPPVRVGVVSRFAPNLIYRLYQPIMDYLNDHSPRRHELALSRSYQDAVKSLQNGEVEASFLGAWMVAHLPADAGLMPVAVPTDSTGVSRFHVVLIVPEGSTITSLADLKGRRVAVPSDQAFSGNWLQNEGLESAGLNLADLDTLQHFDHHETVVWQVLRGSFDAGVVKESLAVRNRKRGLVSVARSPAIPGPPLVIRSQNPSEAAQNLVRLLLALDRNNPQDQALMNGWTPEFAHGFIPVTEDFYRDFFQRSHPEKGAQP